MTLHPAILALLAAHQRRERPRAAVIEAALVAAGLSRLRPKRRRPDRDRRYYTAFTLWVEVQEHRARLKSRRQKGAKDRALKAVAAAHGWTVDTLVKRIDRGLALKPDARAWRPSAREIDLVPQNLELAREMIAYNGGHERRDT